MYATISPVTVFPSEATQLQVPEVLLMGLGSSARCIVTYALCDSEGSKLRQDLMIMDAETYASWGTDDSFVLTWLATQLGLTIVEIVL